MTIQNISNENLYIPQLPISGYRELKPGEIAMLSRLFPEDNMDVITMIHQGKLAIIAESDIENYTFNEDEPEPTEIDAPDIVDTFNNIRFKE